MLVLMRDVDQEIVIHGQGVPRINISVTRISGKRVYLGFDAPIAVRIDRKEIADRRLETRRPA